MSYPHTSKPPPGDFVFDMSESLPSQPTGSDDLIHVPSYSTDEDPQLSTPQQLPHPKGGDTVIESSKSSTLHPIAFQGEDNNSIKDTIVQDDRDQVNTSNGLHISSAPNQGIHAVSFRVPNKPPEAKTEREEKDEKKATKLKSTDKNDGWPKVYNEYKSMDEEWSKKKNDHIDTLLVFAGLFSTVLTAFLVQVYTELHPDNTQLSILLDMSNQLHAISLGQVAQASTGNALYAPTDPSKSLIATTSLWFVSLVLSLGSAFFGILVKQWLREYMAWTDISPAHDAIHVRQYRHNDLKNWRVETIVMVISECLQLGLVLFFIGLATLLWEINKIVAAVATVSVGLVLLSAAMTAVLPAFLLSCPYRGRISFTLAWALRDAPAHLSHTLIRISFGIAAIPTVLRDGALSYLRHALMHLPRTLVDAVAASPKTLRNGTQSWIHHSSTALQKWHEKLKGYPDSIPRVEDHRNWRDMDLLLRLPKQDSNDSSKRVLDMCTSLFWLISHRDVPNAQSLVQQCLSDLQIPGISLELFKNSQGRPQAGLKAYDSGANRYRKLEFDVYCQVLLGSMKSSSLGPDMLKDCDNLQEFIGRVLPYRTVNHDSKSNTTSTHTLPSYAFDDESITSLSDAIQFADRKSHGAISANFFSLANKLLDPQVFFSQELTLVAPLLRILFLLWYCSDYYWMQRYQGLDLGDTDSFMEPQRQSYQRLEQTFTKLLAQPQQIVSARDLQDHQDNQGHYDAIVDILGFGMPVGFFSMPDYTASNGYTIRNIMKSIVRFVEYYEELSSPSGTNEYESDYSNRAAGTANIFWSSSNLIILSDNKEHLEIPDEDHSEFLTAMQKVLVAQAGLQDSVRRHLDDYDVLYIIRHRSCLPDGFVLTLKKAAEDDNLDTWMALGVAQNFFQHIEGIYPEPPTSFWDVFENVNDT